MKNVFFATRGGIIGVGAFIGIIAALLQYWGNPGNMGICVACFVRDITGALDLHRAGVVQYMRPEIIGFVVGSLVAALIYTRGFIFHENTRASELVSRAYQHDNAASYLLVKGEQDLLAEAGDIIGNVAEPIVPSLEAIGGTGDIVTGLAAALTGTGQPIQEACLQAAEIGRVAGKMARVNPGTQVVEIIETLPDALQKIFLK